MVDIAEWKYRIKESFYFTKTEWKHLLLSILVITFAFAYDDKQSNFVFVSWLLNFVKLLIIVTMAVMLHVTVQKVFALYIGFRAEYKLWSLGFYITVLATLLTQGKWYIIIPGGITFYQMVILRLGHFRYGLNMMTSSVIAMLGPLSNLIIATFWETLALNGILPELFHLMTFINLYYAVFSMLPLPFLDGFHMFYASRMMYVFFFGFLVCYIILYVMGIYSLIWAIVLAFLLWVTYWFYVERPTKPLSG